MPATENARLLPAFNKPLNKTQIWGEDRHDTP